jgi:hypothetical protein
MIKIIINKKIKNKTTLKKAVQKIMKKKIMKIMIKTCTAIARMIQAH